MIIHRKQQYLPVTILNTNNLQLHGFKYSYQIQIIFKQIFFIHREVTNTYCYSESEWFQVFLSNIDNLYTIIWFKENILNVGSPAR